jgi:hypothetical protein
VAYAKRYAGGFNDLGIPGGTPADSVFLNAVEAALLELLTSDGSADGQVMQWINASSRFGPALLLNKNVDPAAAIAKSKLDLTGANGIVNADIAAAAAIAGSKLANVPPAKITDYPADATKLLKGDGSWGAYVTPFANRLASIGQAHNSAGVVVTNAGSGVQVTIDTLDVNTDGYSIVANQLLVPRAGYYHCSAGIAFPGNVTGLRELAIYRCNSGGAQIGTVAIQDTPGQSIAHNVSASGSCFFAAGDRISILAYQTSGGSLTVPAGSATSNYVSVHFLGA